MMQGEMTVHTDANRLHASETIDFLADIRQISGKSEKRTLIMPLEIRTEKDQTEEETTYEVGIMKGSCMSEVPWCSFGERNLRAFLSLVTDLDIDDINRLIEHARTFPDTKLTLEISMKKDPIY